MPKLMTHCCKEIILPLISLGVTSLCHSGTIIAVHPLDRPLMSRPAIKHLTLFEAQLIAMPMVNKAAPHNIVRRLPSASARNKPVNKLPTKAPAWMDAVMPPCNPFDG